MEETWDKVLDPALSPQELRDLFESTQKWRVDNLPRLAAYRLDEAEAATVMEYLRWNVANRDRGGQRAAVSRTDAFRILVVMEAMDYAVAENIRLTARRYAEDNCQDNLQEAVQAANVTNSLRWRISDGDRMVGQRPAQVGTSQFPRRLAEQLHGKGAQVKQGGTEPRLRQPETFQTAPQQRQEQQSVTAVSIVNANIPSIFTLSAGSTAPGTLAQPEPKHSSANSNPNLKLGQAVSMLKGVSGVIRRARDDATRSFTTSGQQRLASFLMTLDRHVRTLEDLLARTGNPNQEVRDVLLFLRQAGLAATPSLLAQLGSRPSSTTRHPARGLQTTQEPTPPNKAGSGIEAIAAGANRAYDGAPELGGARGRENNSAGSPVACPKKSAIASELIDLEVNWSQLRRQHGPQPPELNPGDGETRRQHLQEEPLSKPFEPPALLNEASHVPCEPPSALQHISQQFHASTTHPGHLDPQHPLPHYNVQPINSFPWHLQHVQWPLPPSSYVLPSQPEIIPCSNMTTPELQNSARQKQQ